MIKINLNIQNILDGQGIEISIAGMLIVFAALSLISLFIYCLPMILRIFTRMLPSEEEPHGPTVAPLAPDDVVLAAIGFTLHSQTDGFISAE
ncbi:MAG: hypothetical protein D8M57_17820 [Candidatus Scalindua sp. AMX11]|nr:MAG: hypothetical protein DWQ00_14275 [Candidatus Scalindua sp.]NOG83379.1 OadG family protein [Planctomycetota bacterium]RZV65541.1 MAG: hypothetical protein EX341_17920 [Candidatus Scalindua sp. SCAELEC01]TDE63528.1 MAG: hypothetical protein D8M57_17820 [Candidatus Scalindua sp. AMX11]GJQ60583.1 MAG: hypothetical protein SCALA701_33840 [Candidatus Scalindua sp.]